ncbi:MAG: hypothetical protein HZB26_02525 [Candidatus Hydrogenedentes bacterium]|nr:hypothetical protein [Candidatus Hydrogenedentota bacterium]
MMNLLGRCRNGLGWVWAGIRRHPITVGVVAVVLAAVGVMVSRVDLLEWRLMLPRERQDRADLREIGVAFQQYCEENKDCFPPATMTPEFGLPDLSAMKGFLSPRLVERITSKTKPRLCYLGYLLVDDNPALDLLAALQKQGTGADLRHDVVLDSTTYSVRYTIGNKILRIKQGMERFYIWEVMSAPGTMEKVRSNIPLLWEMPTADRPGGFVIFMDGHVEWTSYPGPFPMSENVVTMFRNFTNESGSVNTLANSPPLLDLARKICENAQPHFQRWNMVDGLRLSQCDSAPNVNAGNARGYRIVFGTNEIKTMRLSGTQVRRLRPEMEFVLFPDSDSPPNRMAIPWTALQGVKIVRQVYLGDGFGYRWYANANMGVEDDVRTKLALTGGDDRVTLLEDWANSSRQDDYSRNSALSRMARAGEPDKAAAFLENSLSHAESVRGGRSNDIGMLGRIPGERATRILLQLYRSSVMEDVQEATLSLVPPPFRVEAKEVYLAMLEHPEAWPEAFDTVAEFGWKDAEPIVQEACMSPLTVQVYRHAYAALRTLEGRPVTKELPEAAALIARLSIYSRWSVVEQLGEPKIAAAQNTLLHGGDAEASTVYLLDTIIAFTADLYAEHLGRSTFGRGGGPNYEDARRLFEQLPRETVVGVLEQLKGKIRDSAQAAYLEQLYAVAKSSPANSKIFDDKVLSELEMSALRQQSHLRELDVAAKMAAKTQH